MKFKLTKIKLFEDIEIECYKSTSKENKNLFMTTTQIADAIQYRNKDSFYRKVQRNKDAIDGEILSVDVLADNIDRYYRTNIKNVIIYKPT